MEAVQPRVQAVDAIRAMALFGILFVHAHDFYNGFPPAGGEGLWNAAADWCYGELFLAKAYLIFSFLFGLSLSLQLMRSAERGVDFRGRFLWRLALLSGFGAADTLFYSGDILMIFAVFGAVPLLFYRVRTVRAVLSASFLCWGIPLLAAVFPAAADLIQNALCGWLEKGCAPAPPAGTASWGELARWNVTDGLPARLSYMIRSGRLWGMLAMFLWGMLAGRRGLYLPHPPARRLWKAAAAAGGAVWLGVLLGAPAGDEPWHAWRTAAENSGFAAFFLGTALLFFHSPRASRVSDILSPAGRMSLTCYMGQNVVFTWIFFGWGLNAARNFSAGQCAALVCAFYCVQILACRRWLRTFRQGPLEYLWRSGTRMKWGRIIK